MNLPASLRRKACCQPGLSAILSQGAGTASGRALADPGASEIRYGFALRHSSARMGQASSQGCRHAPVFGTLPRQGVSATRMCLDSGACAWLLPLAEEQDCAQLAPGTDLWSISATAAVRPAAEADAVERHSRYARCHSAALMQESVGIRLRTPTLAGSLALRPPAFVS
ncbi:MAG: hypothetical protein LKK12_01585 [Bacteroidales bacterium]|jgi:hypothetical protein|nr:hypothetical protein [Bacteroidales bacterium]MCI2133054.1 hypothetical protein [Bacteroidales bacterium]